MYVSPHVPYFLFNYIARVTRVPDLTGRCVNGRRGYLVTAAVHVNKMNQAWKVLKIATIC